jgi:hypothetical protein
LSSMGVQMTRGSKPAPRQIPSIRPRIVAFAIWAVPTHKIVHAVDGRHGDVKIVDLGRRWKATPPNEFARHEPTCGADAGHVQAGR